MSAKKAKRAKAAPVPKQQPETEKVVPDESSNLSAIERASFLEGLQGNDGKVLHSTAVEEDLNVVTEEEDGGKNGARKKKKEEEVPQTAKKTGKQRGAAAKREEEEEVRKSDAKRPLKKKNRQQTERETGSSSQEKAGGRRERSLSPFTEDEEEDQSWKPSPKKPRAGFGRIRKSSSEMPKSRKSSSEMPKSRKSSSEMPKSRKSSSEMPKSRKSSSDTPKSRTSSSGSSSAAGGVEPRMKLRKGASQSEVVLDAFLHFCEQYRESVESHAGRRAVDSFCSNVKEQLLEKISTSKELKALKRENTKVGTSIRANTQKLLEAKQELTRAEREAWLLQKEENELKLRLSDLRRGREFLNDLRAINTRYLEHRRQNPDENQLYGASSLPALLLEAKHHQDIEENPLTAAE